MSNINSNLTFHNIDYKEGDLYTIKEGEHFGVLELKFLKEGISPHCWDIVFSIDTSGSMSDLCSDNRSKIDHIKNTLSNILILFSNNEEATFNVYLQTFNNIITEVFDFTNITKDNVYELIKQIDRIFPGGCTNLKIPLEISKQKLKERIGQFSDTHKYIHIELTDGDDTCDNSINHLKRELCNDYKNIFIGFGKEHNCIVLDSLASNNNNEYRFIDKIESAGFVYGEIVHSLLYMKYEEMEIRINNGKIFNWRFNEWVNVLNIGSLSSGTDKTFHVKSETPFIVEGQIYDVKKNALIDEFSTLPNLIDENNVVENIDHTRYLYRQKTQEILYESKIFYSKTKNIKDKEEKKDFKNKLKTFYENMKDYIEKNNLNDDIFWKVLLDDIYITYITFGTSNFYLYTNSRQISQGRQLTYNVNNINENIKNNKYKYKNLKFNLSSDIDYNSDFDSDGDEGCDDDEEDVEIDGSSGHKLLDNTQTTYSTPEILDLMKTINQYNK